MPFKATNAINIIFAKIMTQNCGSKHPLVVRRTWGHEKFLKHKIASYIWCLDKNIEQKCTGDAYCMIPSPLHMKNKCDVIAMMLTVVGLFFKKLYLISSVFFLLAGAWPVLIDDFVEHMYRFAI